MDTLLEALRKHKECFEMDDRSTPLYLPRITIITPSLNSAKYFEQTIQSVISQDYSNLQYVIIDGGSTDGTLAIAEKYSSSIDCCISEEDKGISDAFNKGIARADGDIIGIVSSDDYLLPGALEQVAGCYDKEGSPDVVYGNILFDDAFTGSKVVVRPDLDFSKIWRRQSLKHGATFVAKNAYERYGVYDTKYFCAMDYDLILRYFCEKARFCYIDKTLAGIRPGGKSYTKLLATMRETRNISVSHGLSEWKANMIMYMKVARVYARVLLLRKSFRKAVHFYRRVSPRFDTYP